MKVAPASDAAAAKPAAAPLLGGGEGPIDITSNRLDIDDTGKTAIFTGNVKAQQAGAALETAELQVKYAGGDNKDAGAMPGDGAKIERIVSKSPVVMTRAPQDRVTGASLDYDAANQIAVVNGDVEMTSGEGRGATADKVTVNQKADTILLDRQRRRHPGTQPAQGRAALRRARHGPHAAHLACRRRRRAGPHLHALLSRRSQRGAERERESEAARRCSGQRRHRRHGRVFKTDPTAPIDVEAGRLDVDDRSKQAVFKSDVRAVQADFVVRTSELRAYYTGAAGPRRDCRRSGRQEGPGADLAHRGHAAR